MDAWHANEDLIAAHRAGDRDALGRLVVANERLIASLVQKCFRGANDDLFDDLMQVGRIALLKAAKTFDLDAGVKFATYAHRRIEWSLRQEHGQHGTIRVPSYAWKSEEAEQAKRIVSADNLGADDKQSHQLLVDDADPTAMLDHAEMVNDVRRAIVTLDDRSATIMRAIMEGHNLREIAESLSITHQRVAQIRDVAFLKIARITRRTATQGLYPPPLRQVRRSKFLEAAEKEYIDRCHPLLTVNAIGVNIQRAHQTVRGYLEQQGKLVLNTFGWTQKQTEFCIRNRDKGWVWCAQQMKMTPQAVRSRVVRLGIQRPVKELTDYKKLRQLYDAGLTMKEICGAFNMTNTCVSRHLKMLGLKPIGFNKRAREMHANRMRTMAKKWVAIRAHRRKKRESMMVGQLGFADFPFREALMLAALKQLGRATARELHCEAQRIVAEFGWKSAGKSYPPWLAVLNRLVVQNVIGVSKRKARGQGRACKEFTIR